LVILSEAKDLVAESLITLQATRSFASLRMTNCSLTTFLQFVYNFLE